MTKPRRVTFKVSFTLPPGATVSRARDYVDDAVASHCGSLMPFGADEENPEDGDPMFDLDRDSIKVTRYQEKKP